MSEEMVDPMWLSAFFFIRESVDSLCRDDADMPMPPYIRKAAPTLHLLAFLGS